MLVKDILTPNLLVVTADATLDQMRDLLKLHRVYHLPVVERTVPGEYGRIVGMVSDRDVMRNASCFVGTPGERQEDRDTLKRTAGQLMTVKLITIRADTPIAEAAQLMLKNFISSVPVVDSNGILQGLITWRDVLMWTVAQVQHVEANAPAVDRRAQTRVNTTKDRVEVQVMGDGILEQRYARDISTTGLAIHVDHQFDGADMKKPLDLVIKLPGERSFSATGMLKHQTGFGKAGYFGIEFTKISDENRAKIAAYVSGRVATMKK